MYHPKDDNPAASNTMMGQKVLKDVYSVYKGALGTTVFHLEDQVSIHFHVYTEDNSSVSNSDEGMEEA